MDSSKIKARIIVVMALFFALYLGVAAAAAQLEALIWIAGGLFIAICFLLGRHIWILIPATIGMQGGLNFIPGSPAPWHLMTAVTGIFFLLRWFTRQQAFRYRWTGLDWVIVLVALTVLQAFLRNPAGLSLLGGDVAGGKSYIVFGVAVTAYVLIAAADADLRSWRWAVLAFIGFTLIDGIILAVSGISPAFASLIIRFYSNVSFTAAEGFQAAADVTESRITEFAQIGSLLGMVACSFWRPIAALNPHKPLRGLIALAAVGLTLFGGFRSGSVRLFVNFAVASVLRRKPLDVFFVSILGFIGLAFLLVAVPVTSMPYSIQRVLSILPGVNVRSDISRDAQGSNDFRFDMWKLALTSDRYISNKLLGDGFQFSASEMAAREALMFKDYRLTGGMTTQEMFMTTGSYHGFHVETIRFTGLVGLIVATAALVVFAVFSLRCIRRYRNHPSFGYVLFICMPLLIHPLWYWLVFGGYRNEFAVLLATVGMVKLLDNLNVSEQRRSDSLDTLPQCSR